MKKTPETIAYQNASGFSLIEVMVGLTVGLIALVVVAQVFTVFEGQKRSTTSGGEAQVNGSLALYSIENSARQAGYGLNDSLTAGCQTLARNPTTPHNTVTLTLSPVMIKQGLNGTSDEISFSYGSATQTMGGSTLLTPNLHSPISNFSLSSGFGFSVKDFFLVAEAGKKCSLFQVTDISNSATLSHAGGTASKYNDPERGSIDYMAGQAMVYNLGSTPVVGTYKVLNNQLVYTDNLGDAGTIPLTDHVVSLQAAYGFDTRPQPSSLVVNTWSETLVDADGSTTENAGDWLRVGAIKVAVVTRSPQKERARDANGVCTTTPSAPTLSWLPNSTISISLGTDNEWKCYRYQVFETTIALRNTIWRPQ